MCWLLAPAAPPAGWLLRAWGAVHARRMHPHRGTCQPPPSGQGCTKRLPAAKCSQAEVRARRSLLVLVRRPTAAREEDEAPGRAGLSERWGEDALARLQRCGVHLPLRAREPSARVGQSRSPAQVRPHHAPQRMRDRAHLKVQRVADRAIVVAATRRSAHRACSFSCGGAVPMAAASGAPRTAAAAVAAAGRSVHTALLASTSAFQRAPLVRIAAPHDAGAAARKP